MLVAYTEQNEPFILNSSISHTTLHQLRESKKFYCPLCKQQLLFKIGSLKIPHFAHVSKSKCENQFSEGESQTHLQGKEQLYSLFNELDLNPQLEPYLQSIQQRPDILFTDHANKRIAIEYQCSPISSEKLTERNKGYEQENISPIWIPKTPDRIIKKGIQKITLSKNDQQFLTATSHHPYIMTYHPSLRQFFYITNLIFLHGNTFISKVQAIPLYNQKYPFFIPKPITKNEFKQFLLINQQVKHNYLQARVLISRSGVNDVLLRSAYELRLNLHSLPNYIGIPIKGSEALQVFSIDWQIAVFYFMHSAQIQLHHLKGKTIDYFLRWARLPESKEAHEAVGNYCKILGELRVQHAYQTIQDENLLVALYNHFLAI